MTDDTRIPALPLVPHPRRRRWGVSPGDCDSIVVWFSCGAASAVAWNETVRLYGGRCEVTAVNHPVAEEDPDNRRFAEDVAAWVGAPLIEWASPSYPSGSAVDVWQSVRAMSFPHGAPCTMHLKKRARQDYEKHHRVDWHVLGFTVEESARHERFALGERENTLPVLIDQRITKPDCMERITRAGIRLPDVYRRGYPNANCIGCVKATSPTYWNHVRRADPETFEARASLSRELGVRLVRVAGERIFLDELPPRAQGAPMADALADCGIFCEEPTPAEGDGV